MIKYNRALSPYIKDGVKDTVGWVNLEGRGAGSTLEVNESVKNQESLLGLIWLETVGHQ